MSSVPIAVSAKYESLRNFILDGDLVAVRRRSGWLAWLTRKVTGSPYTHTAIALWLDGGLWAAEMDGQKNVLVPLSQYEDVPFDIFGCPVERARVREVVLEQLRVRMGYDALDLVRIGLYRLFRLPLPEQDDGRYVCSSYSVAAYVKAGWRPEGLPTIAWPGAVVKALAAPIVAANTP